MTCHISACSPGTVASNFTEAQRRRPDFFPVVSKSELQSRDISDFEVMKQNSVGASSGLPYYD